MTMKTVFMSIVRKIFSGQSAREVCPFEFGEILIAEQGNGVYSAGTPVKFISVHARVPGVALVRGPYFSQAAIPFYQLRSASEEEINRLIDDESEGWRGWK